MAKVGKLISAVPARKLSNILPAYAFDAAGSRFRETITCQITEATYNTLAVYRFSERSPR